MEKKIGILTYYYRNYNYGGILQAFALEKAIRRLGYDSCQISYKGISFRGNLVSGSRRTQCWECAKRNLIWFVKLLNWPLIRAGVKDRYRAFRRFEEEIPHTPKVYTSRTLSQCVPLFDRFVCGSDQIWNLRSTKDASYFLSFLPPSHKKIAYGCSIGSGSLSAEEADFFRAHLAGFDSVSVRESRAKILLEQLISAPPVQHVLDPTLLLSREDWDALCPERKIKEDYILYYSFGTSRKQKSLVEKISGRPASPS
jgi:hypothetical protein